jgi:energy-coupling factor transporter ATP-binding protein EcfA2
VSAQPDHQSPDLPAPDLPQPGPASSDGDLAGWRDAVSSGQLPSPTRPRWQVLRAGVVNLWEFDTAEYWFADGRAQFVGQNQSGKSTLMALTTLIMLAGDLDRQYVDTFGERHKSFRYYVESTDDANDRRETDSSLNRGWAWVEYGRLVADTAEFFTTLLYAQARRGAKDYVKQWSTCHGQSRVGRELLLTTGQQTRQPGELSSLPGFKLAANGTEYRQRISTNLFGFDDSDRLDAVVKMLKVLRTPHLGRKLDPVFFTAQMREALPAIAKSEIDELAEGWDQLDKLANDRDSAVAAQQAVHAFLRKAWHPWADSVLRRHADELAATITRFDDVTKNIRRAAEVKNNATDKQSELDRQVARTSDELGRAEQNFEDLRDSQSYQDAREATDRVETLKLTAAARRFNADQTTVRAGKAQQRADASKLALETAEGKLVAAQDAQQAAAGVAADRTRQAGLPAQSGQWLADADLGRLSRAVEDRRGHLRVARKLLSAVTAATAELDLATERDTDAQAARTVRATNVTTAQTRRDETVQELSDALETWAATLTDPPPVELRTSWLEAVLGQVGAERPRAVLTGQVRTAWLEPRATALRDAARTDEQTATESTARADLLDRDITELLRETDPQPAGPLRWSRRDRPASSPDGAPLWLLLDPAGDLAAAELASLEAALDATGLLDAWISPDGVYVADRDGHDLVIDASARRADQTKTSTLGRLASVLRPAQTAGPLTSTLTALLHAVTYAPAGTALPGTDGVALGAGGRWATPLTAGTAGPGPHGAELLGTAARAIARDRRVRELRDEVTGLRLQVLDLHAAVAAVKTRIRELELQALAAPHDDPVVAAAHSCRDAQRELANAKTLCDRRAQELQAAKTKADSASSNLLEHTGVTGLPVTETGLEEVGTALDLTDKALATLRLTLQDVTASGVLVERERSAFDADVADADALDEQASTARTDADRAQDAADNAEEALGQDEKDILASLEQLRALKADLKMQLDVLNAQSREQVAAVATATEKLLTAEADRDLADSQRTAALAAWWRPVDAGLAFRRGLPDAPGPDDRLLTHAVAQSRAARELLNPPNWLAGAGDTLELKDQRVNAAYSKMTGPALIELRTVLESSGGRSASVQDAEETGLLPAVVVLVDSSGAQVDPVEAAELLTEKADNLARLHDEKMQSVLVELLSSTFVEHLRDRLGAVVTLIRSVNGVLAAHPTGANATKLRLKRVAADGQRDAFGVLDALENRFIGDPDVQEQVRTFLEKQIREAQDLGRGGDVEWKEHLAGLLDYRKWFDVVTEFQVLDSPKWTALTAEAHAKDSGGGKVVTLLQPLLATLVALYGESVAAPRPLWLDEAFTGVDDSNRSTMLDLLVEFDLDFLLAGPSALVASAQVPSAAAWFVTRAPAPDVGVDLSLMLWAGRTMSPVPLPARGLGSAAAKATTSVDADRPGLFDDAVR